MIHLESIGYDYIKDLKVSNLQAHARLAQLDKHCNIVTVITDILKHRVAAPCFNRLTKTSPVVKVSSKTIKNWLRYLG